MGRENCNGWVKNLHQRHVWWSSSWEGQLICRRVSQVSMCWWVSQVWQCFMILTGRLWWARSSWRTFSFCKDGICRAGILYGILQHIGVLYRAFPKYTGWCVTVLDVLGLRQILHWWTSESFCNVYRIILSGWCMPVVYYCMGTCST